MKIRDSKSIFVIFSYVLVNGLIIFASFKINPDPIPTNVERTIVPEFSEIERLDYFHLRDGIPLMSLSADKMRSYEEESALFDRPKGVYSVRPKNKTIKYAAKDGIYHKKKEHLTLIGDVKLATSEAQYFADRLNYFFKKDLVIGKGNVKFEGDDPRSKDHLTVSSERMRARPGARLSKFTGAVKGSMERKKKYEGKMDFASRELDLDGNRSFAHLQGDVQIKRESYDITAGKADMYLDNFNKSLKYFVLNDDVKVTEKLQTKDGPKFRKAFAERLEGFGREQKMVLSGAPRVEMEKDVIKGYRITIRENVDLIEVDDAMSDVQVKRQRSSEEAKGLAQ